ncbi:MAG: sugar ABC transporter substrate-binding protein [Lachnospiraceae bacterium]|nr:sugar ABC transporter substrate-binding protein [Lachnospiraceae bacterium]
MNKKLVSLVLTGVTAFTMAACGSTSTDTTAAATSAAAAATSAAAAATSAAAAATSEAAAAAATSAALSVDTAAEDENTLSVAAWDANFNIPALKDAEADYQKNVDPNFKLNIMQVSASSDIETAITTAASAGDYSTLPDIVLFQDHYFHKYITDYPDAFQSVDDSGVDWTDFGAEKLSYSMLDGVHYGFPVDNGTVIMAYRTDILQQCGYTMDDMKGISWDDFDKIGQEVYAKTGKYLLSMDGNGNDLMYMMLQAEGESQFKDGKPYITQNQKLVQIVADIVKMQKDNVLYLANDWTEYTDKTIMGDEVAGVMNGNWIIPTMEQVSANSGKWEITSMPTLEGNGKEGYASNGGSSLYITANCKKADLAKKFLAYTFGGSTVTYDGALKDGGVITTCISAGKSDVYQQGVEFFNNTPVYATVVSMGANVPVIEQSDYHYDCRTQLAAAVQNIISGADETQALQDAEDQLNLDMGN